MGEVDVKILLSKYQSKISELTNLVIFYETLIDSLREKLSKFDSPVEE